MNKATLSSMGIICWNQRRPLPGALPAKSSSYKSYQLIQNSRVIGNLVLDTNVDIAGIEGQVETLVKAMLNAIQLQHMPLETGLDKNLPLLIMGGDVAEQLGIIDNRQTVILPHPVELLRKPQYKRQAWEQLQKFQQISMK